MHQRTVFHTTSIIIAILLILLLPKFGYPHIDGMGTKDRTGAPGKLSCTDCHSDFGLNSGGGTFQLTGIPIHYVANSTYNMTLKISQVGQKRWGFQIKSTKGLINVTDSVHTYLSITTLLNQNSAGTYALQTNAAQWDFSWTAPDATFSAVTFYAAGLAADNSGDESGDYVYTLSSASLLLAVPPIAGFYGSPTVGNSPLQVNFVDTSSNSPSGWSWDFGDGNTSIQASPSHLYAIVSGPTTYSVQLIVSNSLGTSTTILDNYITLLPPSPVADFVASTTSGMGPLSVNFTDNTLYNPTGWSWDFGDGATSSDQNPVHIYAPVSSSTSYTVQLVATNAYGTSTNTKTNYISLIPTPPAPVMVKLPDLKLFIGQSLSPAIILSDYNPDKTASSFSITNNFLGLGTLSGSTLGQDAYSSATGGSSSYAASNTFTATTVDNKIKYSSYKIMKQAKIGITPGSPVNLKISDYAFDSTGPALPPSFGSLDALIVSDTTLISAVWSDNSTIQITATPSFTSGGPVSLDVIASPQANAPFGNDMDKERVWIYRNLLSLSTFTSTNDTTAYIAQTVPGFSHLPGISWLTTAVDNSGIQASGVIQYNLVDTSYAAKVTLQQPYWLTYQSNQWYTARIRLFGSETARNNHQFLLYGYAGTPGLGHVDIATNIIYGIPSNWSWIETPLYSRGSSSGYLQYFMKATGQESVYIDEIQVIQAAPVLVDASRSNTRNMYSPGSFTNNSDDTSGFAAQKLGSAQGVPQPTVTGGELQLDFSSASSSNILGVKMTASVGGILGTLYTPSASIGKEAGIRSSVRVISGSFNSVNSLVLLAAYGVSSNAGNDIIDGGQIIASAEFGGITGAGPGIYRAIAKAAKPYYQFQFQAKNDTSGLLAVDNIDLDIDRDDPNYGDGSLFP